MRFRALSGEGRLGNRLMSNISTLRPRHCLGLWLEKGVLNRLTATRGPGESYSDAILCLAKVEAA